MVYTVWSFGGKSKHKYITDAWLMKVLAPCVCVHVGPVARPLIDAILNFHRTATLKYFPAEQKWLFSIIIPWQKLYHNLPFSNMRSWFTNVMFQVLNKIRFNISCNDKKTQPRMKIGTKLAGLIQSLMQRLKST